MTHLGGRRLKPLISIDHPPRVAFFGHFGSDNPGNEATLQAALLRLRAVWPEARFLCVCTDPATVAARENIVATPITVRPLKIWDRRKRLPQRLGLAVPALAAEAREYRRALRAMWDVDVLIVPGTGLVNDAWGLARWGPYNLFKWILAAKVARAKVIFLSIGAGPLDSRAGRLLGRASLSLADYRSYRDDASREYLNGIGYPAARDPVYPDLVFGLPERRLPSRLATRVESERVVGLGLMVYAESYSSRNPDPATYAAYLASLAELAIWLLEHGYRIRLLLGDSDTIVIRQFRDALASRMPGYDETRIEEQPINSVPDVLSEIAACDVVVATRFHNVLMSMLLGKPVIAISFHHKCSSLMNQMEMSDYCHDIHQIDTGRLIEQFQTLEQNQDSIRASLDRLVDEQRAELDQQYERLFAA